MRTDARLSRTKRGRRITSRMTPERFLPFDALPFLRDGRSPAPIASAVRAGERVFLSGRNALLPDGSVAGLGDPAAQAQAAMDQIEAALVAAGGSLSDVTKLTTSIIDRAHRKPVYDTIGQRLPDVFPVSTGLVVAGLPLPELLVQIDAEAIIGAPVQRIRTFGLHQWFGQPIAWQGSMVAAGTRELFIRGQTGSALDGSAMAGLGRRPRMPPRRPIWRCRTSPPCWAKRGRASTRCAKSPSLSATAPIAARCIR